MIIILIFLHSHQIFKNLHSFVEGN